MGASAPSQETTRKGQVSAADTWGGECHPDFQPREGELRVHERWTASGFANTDLDFLLKQYHASRFVQIGMRANTCIDTTARFAQELGHHVTVVKDAIAAFRPEAMQATSEVNAPAHVHAVLTADEFISALPPAATSS
ncbi:cysteine hydrolase [Streptomyces sp. NBC_01230]|uniref:isochorismatase family cysteine hydrolase n=1 Tax=Streptomyces sp. NBC_01230 TaxID=2903784 RepID=UPI002E13F316|nr:cysteine hydrolase [Streptomyces sp. NBC_01230]